MKLRAQLFHHIRPYIKETALYQKCEKQTGADYKKVLDFRNIFDNRSRKKRK